MAEPSTAVAVAALASLPGVGPARLRTLVDLDEPLEVWNGIVAGNAALLVAAGLATAPAPIDLVELEERYRRADVEIWLPGDERWPPALADDPDPPCVLFATAPVPAGPTVAVVGTRRCSGYGRRVAAGLGRELAEAGVTVVSGVAAGIDGAAQRAAFDTGMATVVGVVGSGLDVVYPRRNTRLWNDLAASGVLLGETPLGATPLPWRFPARNRIIAALADVVVVVESRAAGGSLHTVDAAQDRDRPVMAVPGPITTRSSEGTNRLLADGCAPVCDVDDVLVALGLSGRRSGETAADRVDDAADRAMLDALGWEPASTDEIVLRSGRSLAEVAAHLADLAARGVVEGSAGWWERVR